MNTRFNDESIFFCENLAKTSMSVVIELLKVKGKKERGKGELKETEFNKGTQTAKGHEASAVPVQFEKGEGDWYVLEMLASDN